MARKKIRSVGEIFLDLEELVDELIDDHGFQWGDVFSWLFCHLMVHRPDAQEEYEDGGHPVFFYGPDDE